MDKNTRKDEKSREDDKRKELEDLLNSFGEISSENDVKTLSDSVKELGTDEKIQHPMTRSMDFYTIKDGIENESKKLLKSVIEFYLDTKMIKKNEYIKYKKQVDEMTVSNILFSLKTTQHAIIKILEEIDIGNMNPRMFEVLGTLQNQLMSTVKHQAAYMLTLEEGYKKIKDDGDRIEANKQIGESSGDSLDGENLLLTPGPVKVRGTRNLMNDLKKELDADFEKYEEVPTERTRLTDARNRPDKPDIAIDENIVEEEPEGFNIDDEMF